MIEWIKTCAEAVFKELGPGHSETVYESAMALEISWIDSPCPVSITRQVPCPLLYKGFTVGVAFIDLLVDDVVVELKAVAKLSQKDEWQVKKYLAATSLEKGLLANFGGSELEIVEIHSGVLTVPFPLTVKEVIEIKEWWENE